MFFFLKPFCTCCFIVYFVAFIVELQFSTDAPRCIIPHLDFNKIINVHQVIYMHNCIVSREVKNPACSLDFNFCYRKKLHIWRWENRKSFFMQVSLSQNEYAKMIVKVMLKTLIFQNAFCNWYYMKVISFDT